MTADLKIWAGDTYTVPQWYRVLNKRVQWLFFDNILTIFWRIPFIVLALSDKKFSGLMGRRHAFHTEIWGSIPLAGSFTFFSSFSCFFLVFQKKASASASVAQKPPIPTNNDCYQQNHHDSGYIFVLYVINLLLPARCLHRIQITLFYLMNLL